MPTTVCTDPTRINLMIRLHIDRSSFSALYPRWDIVMYCDPCTDEYHFPDYGRGAYARSVGAGVDGNSA